MIKLDIESTHNECRASVLAVRGMAYCRFEDNGTLARIILDPVAAATFHEQLGRVLRELGYVPKSRANS